jgi:hypothetical protein
MAEPRQKTNKGRHAPTLTIVSGGASPPKPPDGIESDPLVFWTRHPSEPSMVDLREFATGRTREDLGGRATRWAGDFTGRPELLNDLLPLIKQEWITVRHSAMKVHLSSLRSWWRVLDEAERVPGTPDAKAIPKIRGVEDLHELHYVTSKRLGIGTNAHIAFTRLVGLRLKQKGLNPLFWPSPDAHRKPSEVPTHWEMERIRHQLKHGWFSALDRWKAADEHRPDLSSWKVAKPEDRNQHAHAVYRAVIAQTGNPIPNKHEVAEALGFDVPVAWMYPLGEPQNGLYPNGVDVKYAFHLCLLYSGWNPQTMLELDITGRFIEKHPIEPDYHLLFGFKNRGGSEQFCVGRNKRSDSPGTILRMLLQRTQPLRDLLRRELLEVGQALLKDPNSSTLAARKAELQQWIKSPWLYFDSATARIRRLNAKSYPSENRQKSFLERVIAETNQRVAPDKKVRESITAGDFRDAYIAFSYEFSNYSILAAQAAANHKSAGTTQTYLRHKAWRAHSAKKVRDFSTLLWREIKIHRSVDATILRASLESGPVSEDERQRLNAYRRNRSRVGVGCREPKNPPPTVDPEHEEGSWCRVQRCTLCPTHAIVFDDSYELLARRQAEIEKLSESIPVSSWEQSSFPEELENTKGVLQRFDTALVKERLAYWHEEIKSGRHKPISMEGAYR